MFCFEGFQDLHRDTGKVLQVLIGAGLELALVAFWDNGNAVGESGSEGA